MTGRSGDGLAIPLGDHVRKQLKPLHLTDPSLLRETRLEKCCHFVPLLGWIIGFLIQCRRIERATEDIREQLARRKTFPERDWGCDVERLQRALEISNVVKNTRDWPNEFFLSTDPWHLLVLEDEGMGDIEFDVELKEQCGLMLDLDDKIQTTADYFSLMLSDIVDSVRPEKVGRPTTH